MGTLTIRRLDPAVKERLRRRAAQHGHSMEEEVRQLLERTFRPEDEPENAFQALRRPFADVGGVDLELPERRPGRAPPSFD